MAYSTTVLIICSSIAAIAGLDIGIVNLALPALADYFGASLNNVIWVSLVFLFFNASLAPVAGRLADLFGQKRVYCLGFLIFTIGQGLCALAPSLPMLILFRVIQSVGAAIHIPGNLAIVAAAYPPDRRSRPFGITISAVSASFMLGPALGGLLLDEFDWRATFWMRLPASLVALWFALTLLRDDTPAQKPGRVDVLGSAVLAASLAGLIVALNRGPLWGWHSQMTATVLLLSIGGLCVFPMLERRVRTPIVELGLFRKRIYTMSLLSLISVYFGTAAVTVLLPFYFLHAEGFSPTTTGLLMALGPLPIVALSPLVGSGVRNLGTRPLLLCGLVLLASGLVAIAASDLTKGIWAAVIGLTMVGVGNSLFLGPNYNDIAASVNPNQLGAASAMATTARYSGQALGLAMAGTLFSARASAHANLGAGYTVSVSALSPNVITQSLAETLLICAGLLLLGLIAVAARGRRPAVAAVAPSTGRLPR